MNEKFDKLAEVAYRIEKTVNNAALRWRDVTETALRFRPSSEAWSAKEIIGHLIDSASNNHQRFVRLQLTELLTFPDYGQDNSRWISIQKYQDRAWSSLMDLWRHFNYHLAHVMRTANPACMPHLWQVDAKTSVTLFDMMTDYQRHLEVHLDQISATLDAFKEDSRKK